MSQTDEAKVQREKDLAAGDATPWIGVHVLAEFVFCPRAGLIALEEKRVDLGEDLERAPRLDYLPEFEVEMIEAELQRVWSGIWLHLTWTLPVVLALGIAGFLFDLRLWLIIILLGSWIFQRLRHRFGQVVVLSRRLRAANEAVPNQPGPDSSEQQPVNWWSLLKAGFTSVEYEDPHEDAGRRIVGRPIRVLHYDSLRIPVFRKRSGKESMGPQHAARMAAYCHLVETAEGGSAPYGIILFGSGYDGVTILNTDENREAFENALLRVRRMMEAVPIEGAPPEVPPRMTGCTGCHLGRPRVYRKGITDTVLDGRRLPPYRTRGKDRRLYHSKCGDRFRWVPPHERADEKGLR